MDEVALELPLSCGNNPVGFSLDAGGSVTKVIYRSKEDYTEGKQQNPGDTLKLRLFHLPRDDPDLLLSFLRERCDVIVPERSRSEEFPIVYLTGVGIQTMQRQLDKELRVTIKTLSEMECIAKAVATFIGTSSQNDAFYPIEPADLEVAFITLKGLGEYMRQSFTHGNMEWGDIPVEIQQAILANENPGDPNILAQEYTAREVTWPILLLIGGSAFVVMTLQESGKFELHDASIRGGRTLIGLGKLLLGTRDYQEIVDMASKGNPHKVDSLGEDFKEANPVEKTIYSIMPDGYSILSFGKVADKSYGEEYSKEDVAAGLVNMLLSDVVQFVDLHASKNGVKSIVFCGSFFNHPYMRSRLQKLMLARCMSAPVPVKDRKFFKVLRYTGHMGAIGCWMVAASHAAERN